MGTTKKSWYALLLSICGLLCGHYVAFGGEIPQGRVLVIGIDGIRRDALLDAETPNIDQLIKEGAFAENTQILGERYAKNDTVSGPGWSSFLTGVWADKHGVNDNSFKGKNYEDFPHFFTRVKEQFPDAKTASFVDWGPIDAQIVRDADIRKVYPAHGADHYRENDQRIAAETVKTITGDNPHVIVSYFGAVDETGHRHGFHPSVEQYISAIEEVDTHVGELMEAMKARPHFQKENWLVLISTDHGGRGTNHSGGHDLPEIRNTFLIVSGAAAKRGKIEEQTYLVDLVATALIHLGVKIQDQWQLDGRPVGLKSSVATAE